MGRQFEMEVWFGCGCESMSQCDRRPLHKVSASYKLLVPSAHMKSALKPRLSFFLLTSPSHLLLPTLSFNSQWGNNPHLHSQVSISMQTTVGTHMNLTPLPPAEPFLIACTVQCLFLV